MTEKRLFEALSGILEKLPEKEYPETGRIIRNFIDLDTGAVFGCEWEIADLLCEADGAKQLFPSVAAFLMETYEEQVKEGNPDAACNIGAMYYTGRIGEQSYRKAVHYYMIAAEGGCRQAQENLGYCYYYGRDMPVDYEKAFHYFALGAFDGHIRSLYKIGDMYRNGYYVPQNEAEAFRIYQRCEETMTEAALPLVGADVMMRLGDCYFSGIGTQVDDKEALEYYQKAERLFFTRLEQGDFLIRSCYDRVLKRQAETRKRLQATLPTYEWVEM